jgi:hypothetical protein
MLHSLHRRLSSHNQRPSGQTTWNGQAYGIPDPVYALSFTGENFYSLVGQYGPGIPDVTASDWRTNEEGIGYFVDGSVDNTDQVSLPVLNVAGGSLRTVYTRHKLGTYRPGGAGVALYAWGAAGSGTFFGLFVNAGGNEEYRVGYGSRSALTNNNTVINSEIVTIINTYNGGNIEDTASTSIWVNGVELALSVSGSATGAANTTNADYELANDIAAGNRAPECDYLDFAIWDEVLTNAQITWISHNPDLIYWQPRPMVVAQHIEPPSAGGAISPWLLRRRRKKE